MDKSPEILARMREMGRVLTAYLFFGSHRTGLYLAREGACWPPPRPVADTRERHWDDLTDRVPPHRPSTQEAATCDSPTQ